MSVGERFESGPLFSIDRALVSEALREQYAADARTAAEEAARTQRLEGHRLLLGRILVDEDLKNLLIASKRSIEILPAFQDCEGNLLGLYLYVCSETDSAKKYFPTAIGELALGIGARAPITISSLADRSTDGVVEMIFKKDAFVDPEKTRQPYTWLKGERTLTPHELIQIIDRGVKDLLVELRARAA